MSWHYKARLACLKRGYEVISFETDGWYIWLKRDDLKIPVLESVVNQWVLDDNE